MRYILPILCLLLAACTANPTIQFADIPTTGDAANGETLFNTQVDIAPACSICHIEGSNASPSLDGFGERAASRIANLSAEEYAFDSIVTPDSFIVEGFGNAMYNRYGEVYTPQDLADLIAYLLTR